jgi:hypothetical protein
MAPKRNKKRNIDEIRELESI